MKSRTNPYNAQGKCAGCGIAPATSICQAAGVTEHRCNRCTGDFWNRVHAWLAKRGIAA